MQNETTTKKSVVLWAKTDLNNELLYKDPFYNLFIYCSIHTNLYIYIYIYIVKSEREIDKF